MHARTNIVCILPVVLKLFCRTNAAKAMSSDPFIPTGLSSTVTLNDGVVMPMFGLGTYMLSKGEGGEAETITSFALQKGYRLVDTATFYGNEKEVGRGIKKSGIPRSEIFIVTKVWQDGHGYDRCKAAFAASLKKLDCGYVDLYLIHSPYGGDNLGTYDSMLELKSQGLIRSVGVSNFGIQHLDGLREAGRPTPSVNQIELHAMMRKQDIVDYCRENGIVVMGYSPLAKAQRMRDKKLVAAASKYNKTVAQLMIRWSVQKGYVTIPKSSKPERVLENTEVFDWTITQQDVDLLESMTEYGCTWDPTTTDWSN